MADLLAQRDNQEHLTRLGAEEWPALPSSQELKDTKVLSPGVEAVATLPSSLKLKEAKALLPPILSRDGSAHRPQA